MTRRTAFDPLEPTQEPRWYAVRNMHGALLEARQLPPGANLMRVFIAAMLEYVDTGSEIAEFKSRMGVLFAQKGVKRHQIEIRPTDYGPDAGRVLDGRAESTAVEARIADQR
jgi:hypothetical protein